MRYVEIEIAPVYSLVKNQEAIDKLKSFLSYKETFYKKVKALSSKGKPYMRNKRMTYPVSLIDTNGLVLTGFLPRASSFLKESGFDVSFKKVYKDIPLVFKEIDGFTLRNYQQDATMSLLRKKRGVVESATRSGKTLIGGALINALPTSEKILFMGPKDAMDQALEVFPSYFDEPIGKILGGSIEPARITVGNPETLVKCDTEYLKSLSMVILDECHLLSSLKGRIAQILTKIQAPYRFGLTATLQSEGSKEWLAMEGLIGPLVTRIEEKELADQNFIIQPEVEFVFIDRPSGASTSHRYNELYQLCVSQNVSFAAVVAQKVVKILSEGDSVLVLFKNIEHGTLLNETIYKALAKLGMEDSLLYIDGSYGSEDRLIAKHELNKSGSTVVLASSIWKHAVDIPNLKHMINAAGYKGDIPVGQLTGRGKTYSQGKLYYKLIDFLHQAKYLSEHSIARMQQYVSKGYKVTITH